MAEFETVLPRRIEHRKESREPLTIDDHARRQLEQDRPRLVAQHAEPRFHERQ
jgi:hypothetical protein